jgi:MFS family permease
MEGKKQISQSVVAAIILLIVLLTRMGGNIFIPSIPIITNEFGINNARATLNINLYTIVLALSFAFFGPITDAVKSRSLLLYGSFLCLISYLICGMSANIMMIDIGRVILAMGSALIIITSQTWIGNRSGKDNLLSRLAWFTLIVALAPMLAPVLGGYITDHFSWRWNFGLMFILGVISIIPIIAINSKEEVLDTNHKNLNPIKLLKTYKDVILKTPVIRISLMVLILFMFQGAYLTFSSFLFIDEMGFSAAQYGLVSIFLVGGLLLGRFPTLYLEKHFPIRSVILINVALVILSLTGSILFFYFENRHTVIEVVGFMTMMCLGFSGLSVLGVRNCMLIDPARKGALLGIYNFLTQLTGWFGILLTQLFYHFKVISVSIYNYFLIISIGLIVVGLYLFLRAYPGIKHLLENNKETD